jgi:hypothetical protein
MNPKDRLKVAQDIALRVAYEASGDVEKVLASLLVQNTGVQDAPKEFFEKAKKELEQEVDGSLEDAIKDSESYGELTENVIQVADDMGLLEDS